MNDPLDRDADERLADWVDGRMTERERARFEGELRVNPKLRADLAEYERTVATLRAALQSPTHPVSLADRVSAALAAGARPATVAVRSRRGFGPLGWSLLSAAALMMLAVLVDSWSRPQPLDRQVATAPDVGADRAGEGLAKKAESFDAANESHDKSESAPAAGDADLHLQIRAEEPGRPSGADVPAGSPEEKVGEPVAVPASPTPVTADPEAAARAGREASVVTPRADSGPSSAGPGATGGGGAAAAVEDPARAAADDLTRTAAGSKLGVSGAPVKPSAPAKAEAPPDGPTVAAGLVLALVDVEGDLALAEGAPDPAGEAKSQSPVKGAPAESPARGAPRSGSTAPAKPLTDAQLRAEVRRFLTDEFAASAPGSARWQSALGALQVTPCVVPPVAKERTAARGAVDARQRPVREFTWLVTGDRGGVQALLACVGELARERTWQVGSGETSLAEPARYRAAGAEPGAASAGSEPSVAGEARPERLVLRFRLRAR